MTGFDVGAYVPRVLLARPPDAPRHWRAEGSLVFADISGFTRLSDQLARRGREGAEDLISTLVRVFTVLLSASDDGGDLIKFGGDALLISYTGPDHERRACHAAYMMQRVLGVIGAVQLTGARATLRMSVGVHSGSIDHLLPGDDQQDLVVTGACVTRTLELEAAADAGDILVSTATAAALPASSVGARKGPGVLLRRIGAVPSTGSQILFHDVDEQVWRHLPTVFRERPDLLKGGSDHRRAAMGFVHVSGLDDLVARDPAGALERMDRLAAAVQEAAAETGISVLDTDVGKDGYKYFLSAGAPAALEDPEGRMIRALLRITRADSGLPVQAGCASGRVFAGTVGAPFRCTYAAMGDTTNLAARLCAKAGPGEVLAHAPMLERSLTHFSQGPTRELTLKGKPEPVPVVAVGDVLGLRGRRLEQVSFVGRDLELAAIQGALAGVRDGRGAVVELVGEPGIGKTRLAEAALSILGLPVRVVTGDPYGAFVPFHTLRQLLRPVLGLEATATAAQAGAALTSYAVRNCPGIVEWLPLVAPAVGAEVPPTPQVTELDERFRGDRMREAIDELMATALAEPVALLVDDAQWVDETSAEVLTAALAHADRRPWGVLLTRREGPGGLAGGDDLPTTVVRTAPLGAEDSVSLVLRRDRSLRPDQVEAIVARGDGNPYFLLELAEAGARAEALPDTVEELVGSRIDRLDGVDRELLRNAAVIGPRFRVELYEAATGDTGFGAAASAPTLEPFLTVAADGSVVFNRDLYREVAYAQLSYRTRRQLHGQVADAIERRPELAGDALLPMLSVHHFEAGRWAQAYDASVRAGDRAEGDYAHDEAVEFYRRAVEAGRRMPHRPPPVHEAMADACEKAGRYDEARQAYRRALHDSADPRAKVRVTVKAARGLDLAGDFHRAQRMYRAARQHLDHVAVRQEPVLVPELLVADSASHYYRGRFARARDLAAEAYDLALALPDEDERALKVRARAAFMFDSAAGMVDGPQALRFGDLPLRTYEQLGDLAPAGVAADNLGLQAFNEGRWDEAAELYRRGLLYSTRAGDRVNAAHAAVNLAELLGFQGRVQEALELFDTGQRTFEGLTVQVGVAIACSLRADLLLRHDRLDEAEPLLAQAREIAVAMDDQQSVHEVEVLELELLHRRGRHEEVEAPAARFLRRTPAPAPLLRVRAHRVLAAALGAAGRTGAEEHLAAALSLAEEMGADFEVARTLLQRDPDDPRGAAILARLGVPTPVAPDSQN